MYHFSQRRKDFTTTPLKCAPLENAGQAGQANTKKHKEEQHKGKKDKKKTR